MMSSVKHLNKYFKELLEKEKYQNYTLYTIVDSAINREFTKALHMQEDNSYKILLKEPLVQKVEEVAPYLVKLNLEEEYTQKLMEKGFATNWLTYLVSYKNIDELQQELQEMIMPYSEQHQREILFRFYDPRNLENYIMIHEAEELVEMFEDVGGAFLTVDSDEPTFLHLYSKDKNFEIIELEEESVV